VANLAFFLKKKNHTIFDFYFYFLTSGDSIPLPIAFFGTKYKSFKIDVIAILVPQCATAYHSGHSLRKNY
jgi:hypothetical protein